jgi:hypothetical protein
MPVGSQAPPPPRAAGPPFCSRTPPKSTLKLAPVLSLWRDQANAIHGRSLRPLELSRLLLARAARDTAARIVLDIHQFELVVAMTATTANGLVLAEARLPAKLVPTDVEAKVNQVIGELLYEDKLGARRPVDPVAALLQGVMTVLDPKHLRIRSRRLPGETP